MPVTTLIAGFAKFNEKKDRKLLFVTIQALKMFTDTDTTFIDAIVQTGNVTLLLDNIVSLKENPDIEIVKPLSNLVIALVKHDLGREIVIQSQIILPILSWYFSDDE